MADEPATLRVKEFCKKMGISPSTFWKYVAIGKLKTVRLGGCTLVPYSEVERILNGGFE